MFEKLTRTLVIAEIGNNHEGDMGAARAMVDAAAETGVDAVKFQTFIAEKFSAPSDPARFARLKQFQLSFDQFAELADRARAKGLKERRVIMRHAFKAALVSVIPVLGIQAGFVLGGAVYIETVFQWPGIGSMLVTAISTRDLLTVQGGVLVVAAAYVLFNLAADVVQTMLDPRLR